MTDTVRQVLVDEQRAGFPLTERALREYDTTLARLAKLEADKRQVERERDRWERIAEDAVAEVKRLRLELRVIRLQKENSMKLPRKTTRFVARCLELMLPQHWSALFPIEVDEKSEPKRKSDDILRKGQS